VLSYVLAIEELAKVDSSVAITVAAHTSLGTMPIAMFGDEAQKERWLPDLAAGRGLGAFGLTEPEAGSDAGATRTRAAARDGGGPGPSAEESVPPPPRDRTPPRAHGPRPCRPGTGSPPSWCRPTRGAPAPARRCGRSAGAPATRAR